MSPNIEVLFADLLYKASLPQFSYLQSYFYEKVKKVRDDNYGNPNNDWICPTYNTLDSNYKLLEDPEFRLLELEISKHVFEFAKEFDVRNTIPYCADAWINLASPGQYQEFHIHPTSHFSVIYYLKIPENSGQTVFMNKGHNNMFPLPTTGNNYTNINSPVSGNIPIENDLLIFKSDMYHMVEENKSNDDRVTISANYFFKP